MSEERIKTIKPTIWNFQVLGGEKAWEEVVYSARLSGVPPQLKGEEVFKMIVRNDYGSALEHVIIKFDIKMSKGIAPEFLEHRIASHTGFSTRYVRVDEGIDKEEPTYEVILPWDLLRLDDDSSPKREFWKSVMQGIESYKRMLDGGIPRESARYVLPFCSAVGTYHVTINLRSLLNLLGLRLCVRTSPEFRCLAAQLYFELLKHLPLLRGLVGCRGFMSGVCPEAGVTGVRKGEPHPHYPACPFKNPESDIFIPTKSERRRRDFNPSRALETQEKVFEKWAAWE